MLEYFPEHLVGINLTGSILYDVKLRKANLIGADLRGAKLLHAELQGASLQEASLQNAYLQGANLRGVTEVTLEPLSKVKTLYVAKMDPRLLKQVKEKYPRLLEKPVE